MIPSCLLQQWQSDTYFWGFVFCNTLTGPWSLLLHLSTFIQGSPRRWLGFPYILESHSAYMKNISLNMVQWIFFWQLHRVIWKATLGIAFLSFMSIPHVKIQSAFIPANVHSITCLACFVVPSLGASLSWRLWVQSPQFRSERDRASRGKCLAQWHRLHVAGV